MVSFEKTKLIWGERGRTLATEHRINNTTTGSDGAKPFFQDSGEEEKIALPSPQPVSSESVLGGTPIMGLSEFEVSPGVGTFILYLVWSMRTRAHPGIPRVIGAGLSPL